MSLFKGYDFWIILAPILIFGFVIYFYGFGGRGAYEGEVVIRDHSFKVEVADTPAERQQGLSGRESLAADEGMLFVFSKPGVQRFWMKDMLFSIDMIWIRDGQVIGVTHDAVPESGVSTTRLTIYPSPGQVDRVLEVRSGTASRLGIQAGDAASIRI